MNRDAREVNASPPAAEADRSAESISEVPLAGGWLLATISTRFAQLRRQHYGRGPIQAKTYAIDDILLCVQRATGLTPLEQTMIDAGDRRQVVATRENFQDLMAERYKGTIEELTNRKVLASLSRAQIEPDITIEAFLIDRPLGEAPHAGKPPWTCGGPK